MVSSNQVYLGEDVHASEVGGEILYVGYYLFETVISLRRLYLRMIPIASILSNSALAMASLSGGKRQE